MYIHTRDVSKLTPSIYSKLYNLNFRYDGLMQGELQEFYRIRNELNSNERGTTARVYWMEDGGKIISWALVFRYSKDTDTHVYLYTRKTHRRRGYASKIMKKINKIHGKVTVHPHDTVSTRFFSKYSPKSKVSSHY